MKIYLSYTIKYQPPSCLTQLNELMLLDLPLLILLKSPLTAAPPMAVALGDKAPATIRREIYLKGAETLKAHLTNLAGLIQNLLEIQWMTFLRFQSTLDQCQMFPA